MKPAIFAAALTLASLTLPAVAATTDSYQFKGQSAYASFYKYDGECNSTYVDVYAFDNIAKSAPGAPTAQKDAFMFYSNYNYCTGEGSYGYGSSPNATFTSDNSLKSAALKGAFTVIDGSSGNSKTVDVALNWAGTGDIYRGNSHSHSQGPGYLSNSRYIGSYRDAQVSGNVTVDGKNLIANLSSYASLNTSNSGNLTVTKK